MECVPVIALPALMDKLLADAGVSNAIRARVTAASAELKYVTGQVIAVDTRAGQRTIFVSGGISHVAVIVPPNGKDIEAELIRAQDGGRIVMVSYREDSSRQAIVEAVLVYAGTAAGSHPRY